MSKKTIISALSLAIALLLIFVLLKPLWGSITDLRREVAKKEKESVKLNELLAKVSQLKESYQSEREAIDKIILSLPEGKDTPFLLTQMESLASKNGLILELIHLGQPIEKKKVVLQETAEGVQGAEAASQEQKQTSLESFSAGLKLIGPYSSLKSFLADIKESVRSLEITSITFSSAGQMDQKIDLFEFNLELIIYYQS